MAGFGKNPRHGKRPPSSSSSSYLPTISMVVLVTFCLIGVWMLTTSSNVPSQATTTIARAAKPISRFLKDPPPGDLEGQPAEEEAEEVKEETIVQKSDESEDGRKSDGETRQEESQQQLDGGEGQQVETQKSETEESQQQSGESQQEAHDEQLPNEESQQQTQQPQQTETETETKQGEIDWENQQETKQVRTNDFDNNQETNQQKQETESNADGGKQQGEGESTDQTEQKAEEKVEEEINDSKPEIEETRDIEPHIEEVTAEAEQQTGTEGSSEENQQEAGGNGGQEQGDDKLIDNPNSNDLLPDAGKSEVSNNGGGGKKAWVTQADQSESEKERRMEESGYEWELCNVTAGPDYIPCLDNEKAIKLLHIKHYEHRERHCPEESPSCLVPLPNGYKHSIEWPKSRDKIWYNNVPHTKLAEVKGHQNWVKVSGEYLTFPGGGTQFIHGALHYIDFIQQSVHDIAWGKHTRTVLDVGCGVASFGGYLFERDVLTMSFAPKDEHEAQVQLALERGIPAMSAVMGSQRLPFPSRVFDLVHCARCRVPWHVDGGMLLLELNRVLRPGGYFVWSATPVYQRLKEDVEIWKAMKALTVSMCWDLISTSKDKLNSVGAAFFRKPVSNDCYDSRKHHTPPMCKEDDDPNAAWYIPLKACMHRVPIDASDRGSKWPAQWPQRLQVPPYWLNESQIGIYGKSTPDDFRSDYEHWKRVVTKSYLTGFGIDWSRVRNVMDMRAVYGGFSAALRDLKVWSLNVVNIDSPDTLPIIYERGLFGIYHDWCESFSTYPRTYDLLHADHLFSVLKKRCKIVPVLAEVDRIVRPGGKLIVRDESRTVTEVENLLKSLHWEVHLTFSKDQEGILCAEKSDWRPEKFSDSS